MGAVAGPGMESLAVASGSCRAVRGLEKICHLYINPLASASSSVNSVARFAGLGQSFYFHPSTEVLGYCHSSAVRTMKAHFVDDGGALLH